MCVKPVMPNVNIPFQIYSPFAVVITTTLLGRFSTRFCIMFCSHSATRVLVRLMILMISEKL